MNQIEVYLASRWSRQMELRSIRDTLHAHTNLHVISTWIDAERPEKPTSEFFRSEDGRRRFNTDMDQLKLSQLVIVDALEGLGRRGGMNIEIGYAYGNFKPIILVGDPAQFGVFGHVFNKILPDWQPLLYPSTLSVIDWFGKNF